VNDIPQTPGSDEELVAQGCYRYYCNGESQAIEEPWSVHRRAGAVIIRSQRIVPGASLKVQVYASSASDQLPTAILGNFNLTWLDSGENPFAGEVSVRQLSDDSEFSRLEYTRAVHAGQQAENSTKPEILEATAVVFPLLRIFMGFVVSELLGHGGQANVVVPWIKDPRDHSLLLSPSVSLRSARRCEPDDNAADGICFEYWGDQYQEGTRFWFNRGGLLSRYCWEQEGGRKWEVLLEDLNGEPDCLGLTLDE